MEAFFMSPAGNVLLGVIGNVLTEILFYTSGKGYEVLRGKESLKPQLDSSLQPILQKAVAAVARTLQFEDERQAKKLQIFLASPDIDAIVRQIYASQLVSGQTNYLESIRLEFKVLLALQLQEPQQDIEEIADELFNSIVQSCEKALQVAVNRGLLAAHESKSIVRTQMLFNELAAIQKNVKFLTSQQQPDIQVILEFEGKYRQQVADRHEKITPPNFDNARKLPIDKLYVCPDFITSSKKKDERPKSIQIKKLLSVIHRAVLLGNPGGGKSTFALKLCHDLAAHYSERFFSRRQLTPILVVLRDYGAEKKQRNCSILQFIESTANSDYQVSPPVGAFEYLLFSGHVVVIFDGLDELIETNYRQEISSDVESFCKLYPSVPVVVTSREVGYEQAPLDEEKFEIFRLAPFSEKQVEEYVEKWFSIDTDLTSEQQNKKKREFLQESKENFYRKAGSFQIYALILLF
jgi:predicted NACHT family NTPase